MGSSDTKKNLEILDVFRECIPSFMVLSDETRQKIVLLLAENEQGLNVNTITNNMQLSRPAVSHHLKTLKQAGIIDCNSKGTENVYYLTLKSTVERFKILIAMVEENCVLK